MRQMQRERSDLVGKVFSNPLYRNNEVLGWIRWHVIDVNHEGIIVRAVHHTGKVIAEEVLVPHGSRMFDESWEEK